MDHTEQMANDYKETLRMGLETRTNMLLYTCIYMVHRDGFVHSSVVQYSQHTSTVPESARDTLTLSVSRQTSD